MNKWCYSRDMVYGIKGAGVERSISRRIYERRPIKRSKVYIVYIVYIAMAAQQCL